MKKALDKILHSKDIVRLVKLTAKVEELKWKVIASIDKIGTVYGIPGESLEQWEERIKIFENFIESKELKAYWSMPNGDRTSDNPLGFLRFEIRRTRSGIEILKAKAINSAKGLKE